MSKERKSFLLHFDSLGILDQLTDEQCGKLFLACRDFNLGMKLDLDETLMLVFFPFKTQFLRDQEKYQAVVDRNKNNGSKGGRPTNPSKPKKPSGLSGNPSKPKKPDSGSDSGSDSDSGSKVNKDICQPVADAWNESFHELPNVIKVSDKRKSHINACVKFFKGKHDLENKAEWLSIFKYAAKSDFLMGRSNDWSMDFDFIINKNNLLKVLEGKYE